ncbi:hypothetical protein HanIR_Chr15g0770641 [Helianthus annuus]|nr:hypothetical protein HanIR_Chr15g0770641 [Helianthus annuus]
MDRAYQIKIQSELSILNLHLDGDDLSITCREQPEFLLNAAAKEMLYGRIGIFTRNLLL